jgi:hypothetical protein
MIEGISHVPTSHAAEESPQEGGFDAVERAALAGANAIQRLIAERDSLRNQANAQGRELATLSAVNQDLHARIIGVRNRYLELAMKIVEQLEQLDRITRKAAED